MKKEPKISLRSLDWPDIIAYFAVLPNKESFNAKDLVDYFQFKYLNEKGFDRWITPNYITQKRCAVKLINIYGAKFSLTLIDILFRKYENILNKSFNEVIWSLGILSSEKTGWVLEKILIEFNEENKSEIEQLLKKPRGEWSAEEAIAFQKYMEGK